jgi:hypothetical protein
MKRKQDLVQYRAAQRESFNASWLVEDEIIESPPQKETKTEEPSLRLPRNVAKKLEKVIVYMYNEGKISLKVSFEQAGLLLEEDYNESTK